MIKLNLGRNCLKIILRTYGIKEIFVPYYSCNTIWKAIREENCKIKFYHINRNFMPDCQFAENDYILYINYYGLFCENVKKLTAKYKNIIIDNSQSFYSEPQGIASFNSLRKFLPVQNGAYLWGTDNFSEEIFIDELKLQTTDANQDYEKFKSNEIILNTEKIKKISPEVEKIISNFDFSKDKNTRIKYFRLYKEFFDKYNLIELPELKDNIPFCYPLCTDNTEVIQKLNQNNITIIKLWNEFPKDFPEHKFINNVGALPLYNELTAEKIISCFQ